MKRLIIKIDSPTTVDSSPSISSKEICTQLEKLKINEMYNILI